jgi:hypothetical protein
VLKTLVAYRLIDPGSEWRLHRDWFDRSAMGDLLGEDFAIAQSQTLYRCLDKLLAHNKALFSSLQERWRMLFDVRFDVLLYDLTSTYFESEPPEYGKRKYGYSRDKRPDCVQVVIALIVTPEGFPLAYEVLPGNTSDKTTLEDFLAKIEQQYGKAERIWIMDRGIPTEDSLAAMRGADTPVRYLVGTPKGRLSKLEKAFLTKPWAQVRERVDVKLLEQESEVYILARSHGRSHGRMHKERAMRRRRLKLVPTPRRVATHDALARRAPTQARCGQEGGRTRLRFARDPTARPRRTDQCKDLHLRHQSQETSPSASSRGPVPPALQPLGEDPAKLWEYSIQLTEVEQAFKERKSDLSIRPIYHQRDDRIEAHIFVAFLAYCLRVTLEQRLRVLAPGLTPRAALDKFAAMQMVDVHLPTTDGRTLILTRYTEPDKDQKLLLQQLRMTLPEQPPPRISSAADVTTA